MQKEKMSRKNEMKMVQNFYGRDDISRILTGKKELMEKRETRQKRVPIF